MQPSKITVISKPELASGFRLAGMTVYEAQRQEEAQEILYDLYEKGDYALIAIEQELIPQKDKKLDNLMEENTLPVVFPLPRDTYVKLDQFYYSALVGCPHVLCRLPISHRQ